ncbi:MAG: T9SS type A sorting domain-containing protein [Flavobacterium sp.]|nr:T9SS type A sorting domain-containing protein [Flavobacterium sp.]
MKNNYLSFKTAYSIVFLFVLNTFHSAAQDYAVSAIPYHVFSADLAVQGTQDDRYSNLIQLPFNFEFYGISYNQLVVSTNGYIDFRSEMANGFSPFSFSQTIPNVNFPVKNSILGCYQDLNNANGEGTITYGFAGVAPYRKFVVLFDNNSLFACNAAKSTFQMILYETLNTIDIQLIDKQTCGSWGGGNSVTGLINSTGGAGISPPGRNTGNWTAFHEGWRFTKYDSSFTYLFAKCDDDADGLVSFNLNVVKNDLLPVEPGLVKLFPTEADAIALTNEIENLEYTNSTAFNELLYASMNGAVVKVQLRVLDCANDYDGDSVDTAFEDLNFDTNLANDDTDGDGIYNFIDNDDDGDMILTSYEYVFNRGIAAALDTDGDGIANYLDNDDDGDGVLTINEDYNNNNNPADDDSNGDSIPDYLQQTVALGVNQAQLQNSISLFPNPSTSFVQLANNSGSKIQSVAFYTAAGQLVKTISGAESQTISVAELASGLYFVKVNLEAGSRTYKFTKN